MATVEAVSDCRLLRLEPSAIQLLMASHPDFRKELEARMAQYTYRAVARVPLDFAEEVLPADAAAERAVEPEEVDAPKASARARVTSIPLVRQSDRADSSAACLAMICRHYGRPVSIAVIRRLLYTSSNGSSLRALVRGATELGLAARSVTGSAESLDQMPLPAIVHWERNRWLVLFDVQRAYVRVADPGAGLRRIARREFEAKWSGYAALYDYTTELERAPVEKTSVAWLLPFARPWVPLMLQAAGLAVIASVLEMSFPVFTQLVVDRAVVDRDMTLLVTLLVSMIAVLIGTLLATLVQRYMLAFMAVRIDTATMDYLTRRLLALPMSYFATRRTGDIQRRLSGMRKVREFLVQNGMRVLSASTQVAVALVLMGLYSPLLLAVFLATGPLYVLLMRLSSRWLRPVFHELEAGMGDYNARKIDAVKGIETVKALGAEGQLRERLLHGFQGMSKRQFNVDFTMMGYESAVRAVSFLSTALFLGVGAQQVIAGNLTIGGLVAFNSLVAMTNVPLVTLLSVWDSFQQVTVLLDRMNDIFDQEPEQGHDRSGLLPVPTLEGRITLRGVGFQYGGPESPKILDDISLVVRPGMRVAIIGRSGSGKTTLVKCLAGLQPPTSGTITYDGLDLVTLNYRELRRRIGFVLQETWIFNDTIAWNIALGDESPEMDRVVWAARVANALEFIERLPSGFQTRIGESGLALSGGQRQRIAIARALYHDPPVLIFDEATSALDSESERAVKENIDRLLAGRTSFLIAHRLSTIRDADLIVVLEKGSIAETGTHDELMERQGLYWYLVSQQLGT